MEKKKKAEKEFIEEKDLNKESCECQKEADHDADCNCEHVDNDSCCLHHQNDDIKEHECTCADDCTGNKDIIEKLENLLLEKEEKVKYSQAELINYRKRKDEEVSNLLRYANQDLIMELIPLLDNFERAIKMANSDDEKVKGFLSGFNILYTHLADTLKRFGVEEIEALEKVFDPNLHQAMLTEKDKTKENDVVLEVLLKGYMLKGRMIRPASVKVNKL